MRDWAGREGRAGVLGLLASWLLSVWVQLSLLPVLEWLDGSTGDGEDEMDSVLRESVRNSGPNSTPATQRCLRLSMLKPAALRVPLHFK